MKKRSFLENTSYSSLILIMTKMLGVIPVFFLKDLIGINGVAAYSATYAIAVIALELAAGGIPLGFAQFVAKSNAIGDYRTSQKALRLMLAATAALSLSVGFIFFLAAPLFAATLPLEIRGMTIFSLRMFIPTIIVAPLVGVVRGFYNGYKDTVPSAFSQLIEQIVWIVATFVLVFIANIFSKNNDGLRSGLAILANFIAILAAVYILYRYWDDHHEYWHNQAASQTIRRKLKPEQILVTILVIALPTVLVSLMMNSFQMVTNFFYNVSLSGRYSSDIITITFKTLQFDSAKFTSIPLVIANTIAFTTLPFMTAAFRQRDLKGVKIQIKQSLMMSYTIVLFAAISIWVFGPMLYHGLFYAGSAQKMQIHVMSSQIIRIDGFRAMLMGIATLLNVVLVTMNERWRSVKFVAIGIGVKLVVTPILLFLVGPTGDVYASMIAYLVMIGLSFLCILRYVRFPTRFYRQFFIILGVSIVAGIAMYLLIRLVGYRFTDTNRLLTVVEVIGIGFVGMAIYGYLLFKTNVLKYMLTKRL